MKSNYIDIGINLINKQFQNEIEHTIERGITAGVSKMIMTGTSLKNSTQALKIAKRYEKTIYATAGIHPHNAKSITTSTKSQLLTLLKHPKVIATGECGLDFDRNFSDPAIQEICFKMQLELSIETKKPLFLHERAAFKRFNQIMTEYINAIPKAVVHCFTGTLTAAKAYLDQGFYLGFTGAITDKRRFNHLQEVLNYVPLDRIMIETDAPYMLPKNVPPLLLKSTHKRRNEPAFLPYVAQTVADFKKLPLDTIVKATTQNAESFFTI